MNKLTLIYQKKKALSKLFCDELIKYFEDSPHGSGYTNDNGITKIDRFHKNSVDLAFRLHTADNPLVVTLSEILNHHIIEMTKIFRGLGDDYGIEWSTYDKANIQKYYPTQGYTTEHCEYGPYDEVNLRILAWMFYLNDVTDKGGTHFSNQGITLKPRAGDLYIWPAYYTHMHYGIPSPSQIKYIATGWVSYTCS